MSSIPYDPTLVLGQIIRKEKIDQLMEIAKAQEPADLAFEKMNNLLMMNSKLKMVTAEMEHMGIPFNKYAKLLEKRTKMKKIITEATLDYIDKATTADEKVLQLKEKHEQTTISVSPNSPLDYQLAEVKQFPLAFESLDFDVQYVRNEESSDTSVSFAANVATSVMAAGVEASTAVSTSMSTSVSTHKIEGTIIITAKATNKNASIIEPFKLDPEEAISSWNSLYPEDPIWVEPSAIFQAATKPTKKEDNVITIISGCAKASSFVGLVHILQKEQTVNVQTSTSVSAKGPIAANVYGVTVTGEFGFSSSVAAKFLDSSSNVQNNATLICEGCIPNIAASDIKTTVANMQGGPGDTMNALAAMQNATAGAVNQGPEMAMGGMQNAGQYQNMNSEYLSQSVSALGAFESENNKVIDTNSMLNAFTDFVQKCQDESQDCGVPISFYLKTITKQDVAKAYIRRFYPNGASDPKAAQKGMLGQDTDDNDNQN